MAVKFKPKPPPKMSKQKNRKIKTPSRAFKIGGKVYPYGMELSKKDLELFDGKKYTTIEIEVPGEEPQAEDPKD